MAKKVPVLGVITVLVHMGKSSGFTYLEILIVIMVTTLLALAGKVAYSNFNVRKQLEAETKKAISYFDLARTQTIAGEKPCDTFEGFFSVFATQPGDTIELEVLPAGCPSQTAYTFPEGYSLASGNFLINYEPFGTGVNGSTCLILLQNSTDACAKLSFDQSGNLEDIITSGASCSCP